MKLRNTIHEIYVENNKNKDILQLLNILVPLVLLHQEKNNKRQKGLFLEAKVVSLHKLGKKDPFLSKS